MKTVKIDDKFCSKDFFSSNPKNIEFFQNIDIDSYPFYEPLDNIFCIFTSINKSLLLIYSKIFYSIITYDMKNLKKINEIKKAHDKEITNFRHYLDSNNNRDLIMSISDKDNNIKIWDVKNFECVLNLINVNKTGILNSACFLNINKELYIITSHYSDTYSGKIEPIKVFDLKGKKIKQIKDSDIQTYFIDIYYDNSINKNYIITGNYRLCRSYDYINNKIYKKYNDIENDISKHYSLITYSDGKIVKLIDSARSGIIRIWNFDSGKILQRINIEQKISGICLWNDKYLFIGYTGNTMKLIEINTGKKVKDFKSKSDMGQKTIRKVIHPIFGECLISQSEDERMNLWINEKLFK